MYKPVYRKNKGLWQRIEEKALLSVRHLQYNSSFITVTLQENPEDRILEMTFAFEFDGSSTDEYFFAMIFPFSYDELTSMLDGFDKLYKADSDIYFNKEVITKSEQGRDVFLLTISSHEGKLNESEAYIDDILFPKRAEETRAKKYSLFC